MTAATPHTCDNLCESCQVVKSHKLLFFEFNNRSSRLLELIHLDV